MPTRPTDTVLLKWFDQLVAADKKGENSLFGHWKRRRFELDGKTHILKWMEEPGPQADDMKHANDEGIGRVKGRMRLTDVRLANTGEWDNETELVLSGRQENQRNRDLELKEISIQRNVLPPPKRPRGRRGWSRNKNVIS